MVTMEEEKQHEKQKLQNNGKSTEDGEDVDEFGELVTGNESLLSLVQPEVKMLSKHWLAVLKDYALLSLPPGEQALVGCAEGLGPIIPPTR